MKEYARSEDGLIHLVSAINGEYTVCGDAFDGGLPIGEDNKSDWTKTAKSIVTCPVCVREIINCRGVKTA